MVLRAYNKMTFRGMRIMHLQQWFKWTLIISCALMALLVFYKDTLPEPSTYANVTLPAPIQTETSRPPFSIMMNKQQYDVTPKFNYELTGVVVSYNNADGFTDIWHHDIWKDFINVRDLCVIWGSNVSTGIYKKVSFTSDTWTCWFSWPERQTTHDFQFTGISNNHLLVDDNRLKAALLNAEMGDVVHFKGLLVDYKNDANDPVRHTSVTRLDTGNGACEVVYLDEFDVIKKAHPFLRHVYQFTKWMAILSFIGVTIIFFKTPFKAR